MEVSTFTDTEVNNCFSIYHISWKIAPKTTLPLTINCKMIDFQIFARGSMFVGECNFVIASELGNQRALKALFTCVVYTKGAFD